MNKFIRAMLTRCFSARRKKSARHKGVVLIEVDKVMTKNMASVKGSEIGDMSSWSVYIDGLLGGCTTVHLDSRQCTCKAFDKTKIPCGHAMKAADYMNVSDGAIVGSFYQTSA